MMNNRGFTLVEIMIAAAALAGLALVGMQLTKTQAKSSVKASFDSEVNLINNEIVAILSDPNKCMASIGGKDAANTTTGINNIDGKYASIDSGAASPNGYGNANIDIQNYKLEATPAEISDNVSNLIINYKNKKILKGDSGPNLKPSKIKLYVEVNGSGNITNCRTLSSSSADIWTRGTGSKIYYSGGDVGIGNTNPRTMLDVSGGVRPGDETQATVCNATTEGTQRYNKASHAMEYCGASGSPLTYSWRVLGGGQMIVIKPNTGYDGQTGSAACSSQGKSCVYIQSLNVPWDDPSDTGSHGVRVCGTWYNQSLPGIPNASGGAAGSMSGEATNIHSCSARVGAYTTYLHSGILRCGAYFTAICQ